MATFVNNTGSNATQIHINYELTTNRASLLTEEIRGFRVYYSIWGGLPNTWSNIAGLSQAFQGTLSVDQTLAETWTNGGTLFLLFADDGGSGGPGDDAIDIDNFSLYTISSAPPVASCALTTPANGQSFGATASLVLTASASPGEGATITGVGFYEVNAGFIGSASTFPFTNGLVLGAGTYSYYAVATNSLNAVIISATNTITITNVPLSVALTSPAAGQSFAAVANVSLAATAVAGTGATLTGVGFYDASLGFLGSALSPPYTNTAVLDAGNYSIYAMATNSLNATAYSLTNAITITNVPFTVTLTSPANGQFYRGGAVVTLTAITTIGQPQTISNVSFFVDDVCVQVDDTAPYSFSVSGLGDGDHRIYVLAVDNLSRQTFSVTNTIQVLNLPLGNIVGIGGYTNSFSTQPASTDWSSLSIGSSGASGSGEVTNAAGLDAAVQTNSASRITGLCVSATGTPPTGVSNVVWASAGGYLQTRPSQNGVTLMMATMVNNTGTNATSIRIGYDYTTNRASSVAEEVRGQRVYYSLTGATNSWTNIAALSQTVQGTLGADVALSGIWSNGTCLYLLWADDNGSGTPDDPNDIDNFYLGVIGGMPLAASCTLVSPAANQTFGAPANVMLTAAASGGPNATLTGVAFYEITAGLLGNALTPPYTNGVVLGAGTYSYYAVATNSSNVVIFSTTNTIIVTNVQLSVALASPADGKSYGAPAAITMQANPVANTGASITGIGFYDMTAGFLGNALSAPYTNSIVLPTGNYGIYAVVTNNLNSTAMSGVNLITVTNVPLSVTLQTPANGSSYGFPASVVCQAATVAGSSGIPISNVSFYMISNGNSFLVFVDSTSPYSNVVTGLPIGNYGFFAVVSNGVNAMAVSATNTITISDFVSGTVTRGPYLGSRGQTNITIRWRTTENTVGRVRYGTAPGNLTSYADDTSSGTNHSVTLNGLSTETKYYYSIGTTAGTILVSTNYYFYTAPPMGSIRNTRIWFLSDYGGGDSDQLLVRDAYLNYVTTNGRPTDIWLTGGDNEQSGMNGADATYQTTVFNVYTNIFTHLPVFPTCGNHDGGSASAYWNIYSVPTLGQCGGYPSGNQHFYSFDYANIHFVSLDAYNNGSGASANSAQLQWLTNDLMTTTQTWIIAYWHQPPYCKNFYNSDTESMCKATRDYFNPIIEAYGVDIVMNGHCHSLQRTYPISQHYGISTTFNNTNLVDAGDGRLDGTGAYLKTSKRGTVYITSPGGCGLTHPGSGTMPAFAETVSYTVYGSLTIDVNSNRLDFKMVSAAGDISDYFTMLKGASQNQRPAVPNSFAASLLNSNSIGISWSNNSTNEALYSLECAVNNGGFVVVASIAANLTTFTNTGINTNSTYYYRIRAWNNAGYSDYSPVVTVGLSDTLVIDRQPQSAGVEEGRSATLYVLARGPGALTYQWIHEESPITGATNAFLNFDKVTLADAGYYEVRVTSGGNTISSLGAILSVIPAPSGPPSMAGSPSVSNGQFTAGFSGAPGITYTVQYIETLGSTWQNLTNITALPNGNIVIQDPATNAPKRFYRLLYPAIY